MSFEDDFPSLEDKIIMNVVEIPVIRTVEILNNCLDKQRVREAIDKYIEINNNSNKYMSIEDLKKELKL